MKKKISIILLCIVLVLSNFPAALFAAGRFEDTDAQTLQYTDILGMMGIVSDPIGNKNFRPDDTLTRAEFCKMAVIAMGNEKLVSSYKNTIIFPDVRAGHWACGYIAVAAKAEGHFVKGCADGNFGPGNPISYGEALTVIMRILGYTDDDCGGIWPDGYISLAVKEGIALDGIQKQGTITRAQAVYLFVKLLNTENKSGVTYYKTIGKTFADDMTISSIDAKTGKVKFSDETFKFMKVPCNTQTLAGKTGTAVFDENDKLILFLPKEVTTGTEAPSSAAIIVSADGSVAGFDALTGGSKTYSLSKNGQIIDKKDIKQYDVASYDAKTDTVYLCNTRINTYYANCSPSASKPESITLLGGMKFEVLSTAQDMLSKFKPGMTITFMLTAEGKVAGASNNAAYSNMLAAVDTDGNVRLINGTSLVTASSVSLAEKHPGRIVSLRETSNGSFFAVNQSKTVTGKLDFENRTIDGKALAANCMIFKNGSLVSEDAFDTVISGRYIDYYRVNDYGLVDLVALRISAENVKVGKARITIEAIASDTNISTLTVEYGKDQSYDPVEYDTYAGEGSYVALSFRNKQYRSYYSLTKLGKVSKSSWIGKRTVNCGGVSYIVSEDVIFYNTDTKQWMDETSAFEYADEFTLYAYKDIIYAIDVNAVIQ